MQVTERPLDTHEVSVHPGVVERLLRARQTSLRSPHFWVIAGMMAVAAYLYYAVLASLSDIYLVLFFYPLLYAATIYRLRGALVSGAVFLGIILPHTLVFSADPYALVKSLLFTVFALLFSALIATVLNYLERQVTAYREILSLNDQLNSYIERLESTQKQLIQAEKLNAIGALAASVAHELNNPLAGVLVYTRLLIKKLRGETFDKGEALNNLSKVDSAVEHCSKIIRGLLDFARQSEPVLKPLTVTGIMDQVMLLVGHQADMKHIKVVREEAPDLPPVMADAGQLQQVFVNLVVNAIQAMSEGGRLTIQTAAGEPGWVKVSLEDTGHGIAPQHMDRLFTPFFTTREKGTGLGLAISHGIIERHGGKIEARSEVGKGTRFTVCLPGHEAPLA